MAIKSIITTLLDNATMKLLHHPNGSVGNVLTKLFVFANISFVCWFNRVIPIQQTNNGVMHIIVSCFLLRVIFKYVKSKTECIVVISHKCITIDPTPHYSTKWVLTVIYDCLVFKCWNSTAAIQSISNYSVLTALCKHELICHSYLINLINHTLKVSG